MAHPTLFSEGAMESPSWGEHPPSELVWQTAETTLHILEEQSGTVFVWVSKP